MLAARCATGGESARHNEEGNGRWKNVGSASVTQYKSTPSCTFFPLRRRGRGARGGGMRVAGPGRLEANGGGSSPPSPPWWSPTRKSQTWRFGRWAGILPAPPIFLSCAAGHSGQAAAWPAITDSVENAAHNGHIRHPPLKREHLVAHHSLHPVIPPHTPPACPTNHPAPSIVHPFPHSPPPLRSLPWRNCVSGAGGAEEVGHPPHEMGVRPRRHRGHRGGTSAQRPAASRRGPGGSQPTAAQLFSPPAAAAATEKESSSARVRAPSAYTPPNNRSSPPHH